MRKVPSPTARLVSACISGILAASLLTSSPAHAAKPYAPGGFEGYGFDICQAPSQSTMNAWNLYSPFSAVGIYISGTSRFCDVQTYLSRDWVETNSARGWRFIPIHVGRQAPCFTSNSSKPKKLMSYDHSKARAQAKANAESAIEALRDYGFPKKSVVYLDIEWYPRTNTACNSAVLQFVDRWTETLHAAGYRSGLYSSGSAAIYAVDAQRKANQSWFNLPDHMWNAWTNKKANTGGGPYMSDDGWADHQRIHQYHNNVSVTHGGRTLTIDKNYLDVGNGSQPTKEPKSCGVELTLAHYPRLTVGNDGPAVAALQCLLTEAGFPKKVTHHFGNKTARIVNNYRASLGWKTTGEVTRSLWITLLSRGTTPVVIKRGSVGPATWRLQRALRAADQANHVNGLFDRSTVKAVKQYRKAFGLTDAPTVEASVWSLLHQGKRP